MFHKLKAASLADATETAGRREESGEENDQPLAVHLKHRRKLLQDESRIVDGCNMLHPGGVESGHTRVVNLSGKECVSA